MSASKQLGAIFGLMLSWPKLWPNNAFVHYLTPSAKIMQCSIELRGCITCLNKPWYSALIHFGKLQQLCGMNDWLYVVMTIFASQLNICKSKI